MTSNEVDRGRIIQDIFRIRVVSHPDLLVNGKPAWFNVGLLDPAERQAFGIPVEDTGVHSAVKTHCGLVIDSDGNTLFAVPIPEELFPDQDEHSRIPWSMKRQQIGLTHVVSQIGREYASARGFDISAVEQ